MLEEIWEPGAVEGTKGAYKLKRKEGHGKSSRYVDRTAVSRNVNRPREEGTENTGGKENATAEKQPPEAWPRPHAWGHK